MIWTILKADLLWFAMMLPFTAGIPVILAIRARRTVKRAQLSPLVAVRRFKLAQMRARGSRPDLTWTRRLR